MGCPTLDERGWTRPAPRPFSITRADPGIDALIATDAKVELVASGFGLNEGTTWVRDGKGSGFLLVGGLLDNVLYRIDSDNTVSVFMEKAGYTGDDVDNVGAQTRAGRSHVLLIGPSCSGVDPQGRIVWCADDDRKLMRLEKDGTHTVLSHGGEGKRFSGPNDISIRVNGAIYLTDNDFGLRGAGKSPLKELQNGIWRIENGKTTRVLSDKELGGIPNGITFSPDEKYLYLTAGNKMMRYEVKADGTLGASKLFTEGVESATACASTLSATSIRPAVRGRARCASPRLKGSFSARSICRCSAPSRRSRSAPPMSHSGITTRARCSSRRAMPFTRSA